VTAFGARARLVKQMEWRLKKRAQVMLRVPPPPPKARRCIAKAKRVMDLEDDDPWMEKATPNVDPIPRPLTSILKFDAPAITSPATASVRTSPSASDPLVALADTEVASLTPSDSSDKP